MQLCVLPELFGLPFWVKPAHSLDLRHCSIRVVACQAPVSQAFYAIDQAFFALCKAKKDLQKCADSLSRSSGNMVLFLAVLLPKTKPHCLTTYPRSQVCPHKLWQQGASFRSYPTAPRKPDSLRQSGKTIKGNSLTLRNYTVCERSMWQYGTSF